MKKRTILIGILVLFIILAIIALYFFIDFYKDRELRAVIKQITTNTKMLDINLHHNQVLDAAEHITAEGDENVPNILLNFDTHSDYYFNMSPYPRYHESIAAWINAYLEKYENVDTIYWVMPDEEAKAEYAKKYMASMYNEHNTTKYSGYGNTMNAKLPKDYFYKHPLEKEPFVQNCLFDISISMIIEDIKDTPMYKSLYIKDHKHRKIKLITSTEDSLPDLSGADVFLSIDGDYFSNVGFDTRGNFSFIKSKKTIKQDFCKLFKTLKKKHINPTMITMSLSPQYLPKSRHRYINELFGKVSRYSGIKDKINTYSRTATPPTYLPTEDI